jgi:nucleoside-diphosphate-sugar epimerase
MVIILGLGFTGARLARRLLQRGVHVSAPVRGVRRFPELALAGLQLSELNLDHPETMLLPRNAVVALLIPPLSEPENAALRETIRKTAPARVVYVSSTGVYGDRVAADENTPADPNDDRGWLRLEEERWIIAGPWTSLILRAAAIYGPGRGVHAAIREGKLPRSAGSGIVSRIHVDDLAAIIEAGIFSDISGAWPVADEAPCSSEVIARWCRKLLQLKPAGGPGMPVGRRIAGRKVDGRKIREMLKVDLLYPSWKAGIQASMLEERSGRDKEELAKRLEIA